MAGSSADFPAAEFRQGIRDAMVMGLPNAVSARPTFRWDDRPTYATTSVTGIPLDLAGAPTANEELPDVQVPCAVELLDANGQPIETPVANFHAARARLTFLDVDWAKLLPGGRRFDSVLIDGNEYRFDVQPPTQGLFDVDIIQVLVAARDES